MLVFDGKRCTLRVMMVGQWDEKYFIIRLSSLHPAKVALCLHPLRCPPSSCFPASPACASNFAAVPRWKGERGSSKSFQLYHVVELESLRAVRKPINLWRVPYTCLGGKGSSSLSARPIDSRDDSRQTRHSSTQWPSNDIEISLT